jgi:DNA polymerase
MLTNILELRQQNKKCTKCSLCPSESGNKQVVTSFGPKSSIMVVGEAPGQDEDNIGQPFVGRCGKILDKLFLGARIKREQVFITNAVRCRPKDGRKNRPPTDQEIAACCDWLIQETLLVKPKVVITLGKIPTGLFLCLKKTFKLQDYVGKEHFPFGLIPEDYPSVVPCYHPSYLMQHGRLKFDEAVECFKIAKGIALA